MDGRKRPQKKPALDSSRLASKDMSVFVLGCSIPSSSSIVRFAVEQCSYCVDFDSMLAFTSSLKVKCNKLDLQPVQVLLCGRHDEDHLIS